jgi:hypothetical protein
MGRTLKQLKEDDYRNLTEEEISSFTKAFSALKQVNDVWPGQLGQAYDVFLKHYGWHIRLDMSLDMIIPFIKQGNQAVDDYFVQHLKKDQKIIGKLALRKFPHRKEMIETAFKAHGRRNYLISVPLFLMLSEGIFREITGQDLFSKNAKKSMFMKNLKDDKIVIPVLSHVVEAATNGDIIALRFDKDQYLEYPHVLSRNPILHGVDYAYGTITNGYKALSQFEFVIESIHMALTGDLTR